MPKPPDENDQLKAGILTADPFEGTTKIPSAVSGHIGHGSGENWDVPVPLDLIKVPPFPDGVLPAWGCDWVYGISEATQTPPCLAGMLFLAMLATVVGKKFEVLVRPGWKEPLNLMLLVALPPAERKSAVFVAAASPVLDYEKEHAVEWRKTFQRDLAAYEVAERKLAKAKRNLAEGKKGSSIGQVNTLAEEFAELRKPAYPRFMFDDITPERLVSCLEEQGGKLAVLSSEGGLFTILGGRYADGAAVIDAVLKGHAGDPIRVDRVGRPSDRIDRPALTIGLAVQPDVIRSMAERREFRDRGLIARFLFAVPTPRLGTRRIAAPPILATVAEVYRYNLTAILELPEKRDDQEEIVADTLIFTPEAESVLQAFEKELEPRLGTDGDLSPLGGWGGKLAGVVARVAGLLHLAETVVNSSEPVPSMIPAETVERAIRLMPYLIDHARAAFQLFEGGHRAEARRILDWVGRTGVNTFSKQQIWRKLRGHLQRAADLDSPLRLLQEHGYIRQAEYVAGPGRPSETYLVNPMANMAKTPDESE